MEHHRNKRKEQDSKFKVGVGAFYSEDDDEKAALPTRVGENGAAVQNIKVELDDADENKEHLLEMQDLTQRKNYLKTFGKESRHNVISRKDNLMLSPDKPVAIQEELQV